MKLFIVGATGKTGQIITRMALQNGHQVTAFVRSPHKLNKHENLNVVVGDITSAEELTASMKAHDAVLCCLGTEGTGPTKFLSQAAYALAKAMQGNQIRRIGYIASAGIHNEIEGFIGKFIMYILRHVLKDHEQAYSNLKDAALDYTVVRPMGLTDKPGKGSWRLSVDGLPAKASRSIAREDVAAFLLSSIENETNIKQSVAIAY